MFSVLAITEEKGDPQKGFFAPQISRHLTYLQRGMTDVANKLNYKFISKVLQRKMMDN